MSFRSLVNGQEGRHIDIQDRGLAYGDGLFETLRIESGVARRLSRHIARLARGCERLQIELDTTELLADIERILAPAFGDGVLKVIITRASQQRGYAFTSPSCANRYLQLQPFDHSTVSGWQAGVTLRICSHRLALNPTLAGLKHLNRLDNVLARAEWSDPAIHEGLMLDSEGRVVEGTMSNLFIEHGGELVTPSLQRCGVAGVIRQWVLDTQSDEPGIRVTERDVSLQDIDAAEAMFICNSLLGICPVVAVGGRSLEPGAIALQLQTALGEDT